MSRHTFDAKHQGPVVVETTESRPAVRTGEFVARAVALIGGASIVIGGAVGYALGYLEGLRDKGDRREV